MAETPFPTIVNSEAAFRQACRVMPGGVSSPVRSFQSVGGTPVFVKSAEGCTITDVDGNDYIDYIASYGPMIVGHANERVVAAVSKQIGRSTSFGAPTELESQLAGRIISAMPPIEMVRFVNSGTEAVMSAVRLARAATGRDLIVKCSGCYHGHADALLVDAGSGVATTGVPASPGVSKSAAAGTLVVPYNDLAATNACFENFRNKIACIVVEPVAGNMGVVAPEPGYLMGLRELCDKHGTLLLFDEVMTGFRVAFGGAQTRYSIRPDITCLGKIIGGGIPVGAYAASTSLMEQISPVGPVYQAGTLSGNPLAMSAGLATLDILAEPGVYETLEEHSAGLAAGIVDAAAEAGVPITINRVGSMLSIFFTESLGQPITNFAQASSCSASRFATFFHAMLNSNVHLPPSRFESWFVGLAHTDDALSRTIEAARDAMKIVASDSSEIIHR